MRFLAHHSTVFLRQHPRHPHRRVRLLVGAHPRVDVPVLVVLALPAERPGVVQALTTKSWASWNRSQLNGDWALWATDSRPGAAHPARHQPPPEIRSIVASVSASHKGSSQIGITLPSSTILAFDVSRARIDASTFMTPPMQNGVE